MKLLNYIQCSTNIKHIDIVAEMYTPADGYYYDTEWTKWSNKASFNLKDNYKIAKERLLRCDVEQTNKLDLSHLGLESFPSLPPHVKYINLSHNNFTKIPCYHKFGPEEMDFSFCKIKKLPRTFPITLKKLVLTGNPLNKQELVEISDGFYQFEVIYEIMPSLCDANSQTLEDTQSERWDSMQVSRLRAKTHYPFARR